MTRDTCPFAGDKRRKRQQPKRVTEYGLGMAPSADEEARTDWPAALLPPGEIAGRDSPPNDVSKEESANADNWWWGPGRTPGEEARVWFKRRDGKWEEMFIVEPSPVLRAAGIAS